MAKTFSGRQVIKILIKHFSFIKISSRGSHVKLKKIIDTEEVSTIIPLHEELAHGTLRGVLFLAKIEYQDFIKMTRGKWKISKLNG